MTTGRINQVRTIGGARARRAPPARVRAPTRARAPQGPASRRAPSRFVGRHAASARSRRLRMPGRVSPRLGGACLRPARGPSCHAGWPPRALARQPPACAALSLGPVQAASDARARLPAPRRSVPQAGPGAELPMRGGPRGRSFASPRPAPPSASARSRRLQTPGHVSQRLGGARLRPGWGPSCPCGVAPSGTRSPAPGLRRPRLARPHPLPKWEGRREASSSSPPVFGRGGASGAQAGGPRPRPGSRLSAAHLRTGGEEECTGTADTNPGCNYLVRGYSPSMHYFWRGDMPHFSPPLPFQPRAGARPRRARSGAPACAGLRQSPTPAAGASSTSAGLSGAPAGGGQWWSPDPRSRRAFDLGRPEQGARTCQAAVTQPVRRACRQPWPARHPCRRGPARRSPRGPSAAGRDRRNLKLARHTGRWPAEASAGPRRRRPCPIFTLLLILLTTPS